MSLATLLYRCPLCGQDPVEARSDQVVCPSCTARFEPAPATGESRIRVIVGERIADLQAVLLVRRINRMGGAASRALGPDGDLHARAQVEARFVSSEVPLRFRDRLLGFIERLGGAAEGELVLDGPVLELHPLHRADDRERNPLEESEGREFYPVDGTDHLDRPHRWPVESIDSLQTSSSAVQISLGPSGVVLFRFSHDSVRRWDDLIRRALRRRWRELGRGEIREFQPRLRAR